MKTRIVALKGIVARALCIIAVGLITLQGSAAAENTVKGSMKYGKSIVTYVDAAAGLCKGSGNVVVNLNNEKIDRTRVIPVMQEECTAPAASNQLTFSFDDKGKLRHYEYNWSERGASVGAGLLSPAGLVSKVTIAKGRAKGRVYTKKPHKDFDDKYTFDVTFDVEIADGK